MTIQGATFFLAETADDARRAMARGEEFGRPVVYVALRPEASYAFERRKISCRTRANYFDADTANAVCRENDGTIERVSSLIDNMIRARPENTSLMPATNCFVSLKILFDVVAVDALVIQTIINRERPVSIHVFPKLSDPGKEEHLPYATGESVYAEILSNVNWGIPVTCEPPAPRAAPAGPPPSGPTVVHAMKKRARAALRRHHHLFNFSYVLDRKGLEPALRTLTGQLFRRNGKTLLLYGGGYNWDDSLEELSFRGVSTVLRLEDSEIPTEATKNDRMREIIWKFCKDTPEIRASAIVAGMDLTGILLPKMADFIAASWRDASAAYTTARDLIRKQGIHALLLSTRDTPKGGHVIQAARDEGIPVISWQHGGAGYFDLPLQMYSELKGSDLHLVFGEGVKKTFEGTCRNHPQFAPPAIHSVGSSSLDGLHIPAKVSAGGKRHVVYISTVYHNNMYYYPFRTGGNDFDESLWAFQRRMLNLAQRHPDCDFSVKLYPSHTSKEPLQSYCCDHACDNVRLIVQEKTVTDLLEEADVLVFDIVTTAILQAFRSEKEVFVYTGIYRPDEDAMALLKRRAHATHDPDACIRGLDDYLNGNMPEDHASPADSAFLQYYGTYRNDGGSAIRAASVVERCLTRNKNQGN